MRLLFLIGIFVNLFLSLAIASEPVVLQLNGDHSFRYAGYYAAKWQGFYEEEGLDVDIKSSRVGEAQFVDSIKELKTGRAQFAVAGLDILEHYDAGVDLKVLRQYINSSFLAYATQMDITLEKLFQKPTVRVALSDLGTAKAQFDVMMQTLSLPKQKVEYVKITPSIRSLLNDQVDIVIADKFTLITEQRALGSAVFITDITQLGLRFFGDSLITVGGTAQLRSNFVQKFITATEKGWRYAIDNKLTMVTLINERHASTKQFIPALESLNSLLASEVESFFLADLTEDNNFDREQWQHSYQLLLESGWLDSHVDFESMAFTQIDAPVLQKESAILYVVALTLLVGIFYFWHLRNITLTVTAIIGLAIVVVSMVEDNFAKQKEQREKLDALRQLNSISEKLKGNLQTNLSMLKGFAAYISAEPDLTYEQYSHYAREIFRKDTMLINFAAAKDLVVNYVYPLEGNEAVVGLDYRKNEKQRAMVLQVAETGRLMVVGPVNLVQGGVAFIGRVPIFFDEDEKRKLWGIISSPLDAEKLYQNSGVYSAQQNLNLAIRTFDSLGQKGPVFFGDPQIFESGRSVQVQITVGDGRWVLAAEPKDGFYAASYAVYVSRITIFLATLFIVIYVVIRFRQDQERALLEKRISDNRNLLEKVGSVARVGGWKISASFEFIQWSRQSSILLGTERDYRHHMLQELGHFFLPEELSAWQQEIQETFDTQLPFDIELKLKNDDPDSGWLRIIGNYVIEDDTAYVTGTLQDISDKVISSRIIERQATYDALTNLPNRTLFNDRLLNAIEYSHRNNKQLAVLFIDLDRFKPVNDTYGHQVGDRLLQEAASRIQSCLRESDTVSRLSGDEFGVIALEMHDYKSALRVVEKIQQRLEAPYFINDVNIYSSSSIGIALYPSDDTDASSLVRKADQAMYEVKRSGRNGWHFYTQEMQEKSEYRHELLSELNVAVEQNQLMAYYQPIFDLRTMQIARCESLARWQKADQQFVSPAEFISLAEETGLINKIDLQMLEQSVNYFQNVECKGERIGISINISPRLFQAKDRALENWIRFIREHCHDTDITVEITERLLTDESHKAKKILDDLKDWNVKVAIDDFGTGYSSLSYLVNFPVDIIKIDRAFVDAIGKRESSETLVETILAMAKKLGMKVVAEGIETQEQLDFLVSHQCDYGQGFYLGKPMSPRDFESFVQTQCKE